jgi:hypothetical protein
MQLALDWNRDVSTRGNFAPELEAKRWNRDAIPRRILE